MLSFRIPSIGSQPASFAAKITDNTKTVAQLKSAATPTPHSIVTCGYQAHVAGFFRNVTVLWSRNLLHHSLTVMVSSLNNDMNYCCKIDLVKPWQFWSKRGSKSFDVEGNFVEVFWDLRSAKLSGNGSPEPMSDYYVAIVSDEEVVLLLGDLKHKAYKRTKSRPALVEGFIYFKKESIFGKRAFSTRARFDEQKKEHEVVVETSKGGTTEEKDPEMWISIDGIVVVHVRNLQWKFRGNQMVLVDRTPIIVYYDVHDWLFGSSETATSGLFLFKPVPDGAMVDDYFSDAEEGDSVGGSSPLSRYNSTSSGYGSLHDFCLFLYAWKLE